MTGAGRSLPALDRDGGTLASAVRRSGRCGWDAVVSAVKLAGREQLARLAVARAARISPLALTLVGRSNCFVFLGPDAMVYRVPRTATARAGFAAEVDVLEWLAGRLPVATPAIRRLGRDPAVIGYRAIAGVPRRAATRPARWIEDLADALAALHRLEPPAAWDRAARRVDLGASLHGRRIERLQRAGLAAPAAELRAAVDAAGVILAETTVPCHGDLRGENLLSDPATGRLVGLIDFGAWAFAPREWDIARCHLKGAERDRLVARYVEVAGLPLRRDVVATLDRVGRLGHRARRLLAAGGPG